MYYTVYKITNLVNNKIYIGVHKTSDLSDDYMGSGKLIKRAIEKYGIENFEKEYIEIFDNSEDMFNMESQLVNEEFVSRDDTYNLKEGGFGGWDYNNTSNGVSKRMSQILNWQKNGTVGFLAKYNQNDIFKKNRKKLLQQISEQGKKRIDELYPQGTFFGKKHNDDTKKRIGEKNSINQKGSGNSQYGTMWIHNIELNEDKKIKKDNFSEWEILGWLKGRLKKSRLSSAG